MAELTTSGLLCVLRVIRSRFSVVSITLNRRRLNLTNPFGAAMSDSV